MPQKTLQRKKTNKRRKQWITNWSKQLWKVDAIEIIAQILLNTTVECREMQVEIRIIVRIIFKELQI